MPNGQYVIRAEVRFYSACVVLMCDILVRALRQHTITGIKLV